MSVHTQIDPNFDKPVYGFANTGWGKAGLWALKGGGVELRDSIGTPFGIGASVRSMPTPWATDPYGFVFTISDADNAFIATVNVTPEQEFDFLVGTLPLAYFVDVDTGNDANAGTSAGLPLASMHVAITKMNTAAVGGAVVTVAGNTAGFTGIYPRQNSLSASGTLVTPNFPIKWLANLGQVTSGPFDVATAFVQANDPNYQVNPATGAAAQNLPAAGVYVLTGRPNVDTVVDTSRRDRYGKHLRMQYVPTFALCKITPNSWTDNGANTDLWVHMTGGEAPTVAKGTGNLRYYLLGAQMNPQYAGAVQPPSQGWFTRNGGSWRFEGGTGFALVSANGTQPNKCAFIIDRAQIWFQGGQRSGPVNAFATVGINGLQWLANSEVQGSTSDGCNIHNVGGFTFSPEMLSTNNRYIDLGGLNGGSVQAVTGHENCRVRSFGDVALDTHGYAFGFIDQCVALVSGAVVVADYGDMMVPGSILRGGCFLLGVAAQVYSDRVRFQMGGASDFVRFLTTTTTATLYERETLPQIGIKDPTRGTVTTWV